MKQEKRDQLRHWFESLEQSKQVDIALECIEELILTESINFYETTVTIKIPTVNLFSPNLVYDLMLKTSKEEEL